MFVMRPLLAVISGVKAFAMRIRAVHVHVHEQVELFHAGVGHRSHRRNAGVVDQRVEPAALARDGGDRRVDVFLFGDVEFHGAHILDGAERIEIRLFARAGVDEVAASREMFGDLAADPVLAPVTSTAFTVAAGDSLAGTCANAAMETVKESIAVAVRMSLFMADHRLLFQFKACASTA